MSCKSDGMFHRIRSGKRFAEPMAPADPIETNAAALDQMQRGGEARVTRTASPAVRAGIKPQPASRRRVINV